MTISQHAAPNIPILPRTSGQWRAIYWEPVVTTGERICVGFVTSWEGQATATLTVRPDLLSVLFGAAGVKAQQLLERAVRILNGRLSQAPDIEEVSSPISGIYFGQTELCHVNSYPELLQVGKLMSSSLSSMSEPDYSDSADVTEGPNESGQPNRQFATRVRDLAVARTIHLAAYFNKEASLMSARRSVRFGFLSDSLAAHFGLLQPTYLQRHVRTARGLLVELSLAQKNSGRTALLVLGFPPLNGANLTDKERSALSDYLHELSLESTEFNVKLAAADNDSAACDALLAEV